MLSDAECSFSNDSLDDCTLQNESSQKDSSTVTSEFSSTKTLMNIDDDTRLSLDEGETPSKGYFLSKRYSDSMETDRENSTAIQYSWQVDGSHKEQTSTIFDSGRQLQEKMQDKEPIEHKYSSYITLLKNKRSALVKFVLNNEVKHDFAIEKTHVMSSLGTEPKIEPKHISTSISSTQNAIKHEEYKQAEVKISNVSKQLSPIRTEDTKYTVQKTMIGKPLATIESFSLSLKDTFKKASDNSIFNEKFSMDVSTECRKKKIVLDFGEFPPSKSERKIYEYFHSIDKKTNSPENQKSPFCLSLIEERTEMPSTHNKKKLNTKIFKTIPEKFAVKPIHDCKRKYHTYPKSKIPVSKYSKEKQLEDYTMNPRIFPLEPREIDLESFQQLHTADSQEELQEFLLLESQCSGNFELADNISTYSEYSIEDERGTMSDY
ncbi:uncharacterized protein LOC112452461 [Temnothorax curvispinosus]|uniref:Uncharacterized protein LOC112452461 n=1 Tax=Temnothorax curvispinosus TaxID=300111 RepID=A0A6J1PG06_9HYME|nr:uncharacterized protein LOC112452461 [Temnothorax curvispinosus]